MKPLLALAPVLLVSTAAAAAPVPPTDQTAIRALLDRLYATYRTNKPGHEWGTVIGKKNVFTPATLKLWDDNTRLLNGDVGAIDVDVFCACQDFDSIRVLSTVLTALANKRVAAVVTFDNHGRRSIHIQFEKTPAGWRVYDVSMPQQGTLRTVLIHENAELAKSSAVTPAPSRPAAPAFPTSIEYVGRTGSEQFPVWNDFKVTQSAGTLGGSAFMQLGILTGDAPITGTYANGECTVVRKKQTYRGHCDANEFSGIIYSASGKPGDAFRFLSMAQLARLEARQASGAPRYAAPSAAADDAPPQAVLAPSYGRARLLVEPGGGCSEGGQLVKGYCFDRVIGYLRSHPDQGDTIVVTMTRSYLLGTWVPFNSGQGRNVYKVKRQGEAFIADRERQFTTKVNPPQGCAPATVNDEGWIIGASQSYKIATEAKHFLCDPSRSSRIASQAPRSLPNGGSGASNGAYRSPQPSYTRAALQPAAAAPPADVDTINGASSPAAFRMDDTGIITGSPFDSAPAPRPHRKRK